MQSDNKTDASTPTGTDAASPKSSSRRRLLRAGVGAAPVVLTVVSLPVHATNCRSASASASANAGSASANARPFQVCTGYGAAAWKGTYGGGTPSWPNDCKTATSYFPACLGGSTISTYGGGSKTIKQALGDTTSELARLVAAAYLNTRLGVAPAVTPAQLRTIFDTFLASPGGNYSPVAGVQWNWTTTKAWLINNGIAAF